ncbi:alkaline shock response membrane anchor protein AmaP [Nocardia yunnanensis]|uniref:Alkaline shock response membrane anchor protein AmaP n=1 Tax=Nocardia yunnanensis TaxID=2382165 RepID=A0A386ZHS4_9NOCA|nr:alkaline shock response membrane anchor protein AmaP [Nocardia yunnanensis]AYF76674.1 alkaline shock response membrane anchor protein AmaP [Nocardia yunnanensis]
MTSSLNRPARLNRALLALAGLTLLAAGGYALAAYGDKLPWVDSGDRLTPGTAAPPSWVLALIAIAAVVIGLGCLRWVAAQLRRVPKAVPWELSGPEAAGRTTLSSAVAARAVAADIEGYPEVGSVSAVLSGPGRAPELHVIVTASAGADLTDLRRRILGEAVPRLRSALAVGVIPVTMEFRLADNGIALQ